MTVTFIIWELLFVLMLSVGLSVVVAHYWEMISRYKWAKRRADALRRALRRAQRL
jgi:hypothetical protein